MINRTHQTITALGTHAAVFKMSQFSVPRIVPQGEIMFPESEPRTQSNQILFAKDRSIGSIISE